MARIFLEEEDVTDEIRTEASGNAASKVGGAAWRCAMPCFGVAARATHGAPGLVADGRDMGTVVFPGAPL